MTRSDSDSGGIEEEEKDNPYKAHYHDEGDCHDSPLRTVEDQYRNMTNNSFQPSNANATSSDSETKFLPEISHPATGISRDDSSDEDNSKYHADSGEEEDYEKFLHDLSHPIPGIYRVDSDEDNSEYHVDSDEDDDSGDEDDENYEYDDSVEEISVQEYSSEDDLEDDSDSEDEFPPNFFYLNFIEVIQFIAQEEGPNSIYQGHDDRPSPLPGNSNPWNSPQAAAEVLPTNTIATTNNTRGESYEYGSGLQSTLRRVINYYPSLVTANQLTVLLIGIRERWIEATMKQAVVENNESMGIWKDCYCGNNNNTIGGGTMDAEEECFDDLTNTLESSRYRVLRNKALFQF